MHRLKSFMVRMNGGNLALHIAKDSAEIHFQLLLHAARPFHLLGFGIASMLEKRLRSEPRVALAQHEPGAFRFPVHCAETFQVQSRIRGKRDGLGLDRRIQTDLPQMICLNCLRRQPNLNRQLEQPLTTPLSNPLPKAGHL